MFKKLFLSAVVVLMMAASAFAAHPLITDDTGTQGRGKAQLEIIGAYEHDNKDGVTTNSIVVPVMPAFSYGITDNIDIVLGISYQHVSTVDSQNNTTADGISDASIELKWRFYEKDGLSLALKPGLTLPTGDHERGLGAGKVTYSAFFITTKEIQPWAFHLNLGYIRNENRADERKNLWHASVAAEVEILKDLKVVGNIGVERNTDRAENIHPAFILGGVIYSLSEGLDIDFGIKRGLNRSETDYSVLAGLAWRF